MLWPWWQRFSSSSEDRYRLRRVSQMLFVCYNLLNNQNIPLNRKQWKKGLLIGNLRRTFCPWPDWSSINVSSKLSLTYVGNVNYYVSVHHPIPTRANREDLGIFQNKSLSSPFNYWVSRYILFLAKLNARGRPFWRVQRGGSHCDITPVVVNGQFWDAFIRSQAKEKPSFP